MHDGRPGVAAAGQGSRHPLHDQADDEPRPVEHPEIPVLGDVVEPGCAVRAQLVHEQQHLQRGLEAPRLGQACCHKALAQQDPQKAKALWNDIQELFYNDSGHVIWGHYNLIDGLSPKVNGATSNTWPLGTYGFRSVLDCLNTSPYWQALPDNRDRVPCSRTEPAVPAGAGARQPAPAARVRRPPHGGGRRARPAQLVPRLHRHRGAPRRPRGEDPRPLREPGERPRPAAPARARRAVLRALRPLAPRSAARQLRRLRHGSARAGLVADRRADREHRHARPRRPAGDDPDCHGARRLGGRPRRAHPRPRRLRPDARLHRTARLRRRLVADPDLLDLGHLASTDLARGARCEPARDARGAGAPGRDDRSWRSASPCAWCVPE